MITNFNYHDEVVTSAKYSYDGGRIATSGVYAAKVWDAATGNLIADLTAHKKIREAVEFNKDGTKIMAANDDNSVSIWDAKTYKSLYTYFYVDSTDYLVYDSLYHYDGSEAARKLLYFTCGGEIISLDQVKDQLWVPNLADRIMKGETIDAPTLSSLNICGLVPLVEQTGEDSSYRFVITPRAGGLGETVLYVNNIEVKRFTPAQLTKATGGYTLTVDKTALAQYLIAGQDNPVTVKAYTAQNDISSRGATVTITPDAQTKAHPNLYAVMIGVSDYKGEELDLKYAAKDAQDLSKTISASAGKLLNDDGQQHVFMYNLTTAENHYLLPEKNSIKKVLDSIGSKATANDILLVFFSGHGVMQGDKKQFYFLTADASKATATGAPETVGISTQELSDWLKPANIKAQKRILIFDACNSGQAINELVTIGGADQNYMAARNDDKAEQIKAIEKLNEKSGFFILSASASSQNAYELGRYAQGLLTYSLLKAVKEQPDILESNKYLDVSRWFNAAEKIVSNLAATTGAQQQPQMVTAGNFNIGIVDTGVIAGIQLPQEKALFTASNFQNEDEAISFDDIGLNKVIDNQLADISARGTEGNINFMVSTNAGDAYSLSGRYRITGNDITVKVNVLQNRAIKNHFEIKGDKNNLENLAQQISQHIDEWVKGR